MIITTNRKALTVHEPTPRLALTHRPGFTFDVVDQGTGDECVTLFDSDAPGFPCNFCIHLFTKQGEISSSIQPTRHEWVGDPTPSDLCDIADLCDGLQQWFDDCATVLDWAMRNYTRGQGEEARSMN
ncbi:MAG: hypothetical protein SOI64_07555 [Bifidobacterium mongoliense]|uniref:hypothetical protein n=1 Tax=Bifidobacterium mongoliense TaxID=518643 RepID=UPI002F35EDDA